MKRNALGLALIGSVLPMLFACMTVGPDYKVPEKALVQAPEANAGLVEAGSTAASSEAVPDAWWRLYDDREVNALVQRALVANTNLRVAAANLQRAIANYHEVEAENLVQGSINASTERTQLAGEAFLLKEKVPVLNIGNYGIGVSYLVDLFGKLARADEAALANAEASRAALDAVRVAVVAQTVKAYVEGCAATDELHAAERQLALQERAVDLTRKLVVAGRSEPGDLDQANAEAGSLRAALPQFKARRTAAAYRLSVMLGQPPARTEYVCHGLPTLKKPLPVGDGAALLRRRPDVRQAERELASSVARIGVATADLFPTIRLGASAGVTGVLSDLGSGSTVHWGVGPMITWNFPSNGAIPHIHGMKAESDAALARFDGVVLKALEETRTALSAYGFELERNAGLRKARDAAADAAREKRILYAGGRVSYLVSLNADRSLVSLEQTLADSDAQVALKQVALFEALGGGWENAPMPASKHAVDEKSDSSSHS
ncbi:efflux transporter outer membrane subunit [Cupriavidus sp. RAF12]|uniref:efflux transporter outer membrane subunit n=1 Tax=Cupriavidus sp. RAF12 TaxID=3233050 RepID=UPI003F93C7CF